jgi:hypothetical protein
MADLTALPPRRPARAPQRFDDTDPNLDALARQRLANAERVARHRATRTPAEAAQLRRLNAEQHRRSYREQRAARGRTFWWDNLPTLRLDPYAVEWRAHPCQHCGARLLENEPLSFCCGGGKWVLPRLRPYPTALSNAIASSPSAYRNMSRALNNLFRIGYVHPTGEWARQEAGGEQTFALRGRTYSQMRPPSARDTTLFWTVYDEAGRSRAIKRYHGVRPDWIGLWRRSLEICNPVYQALGVFREHLADSEVVLQIACALCVL